MSYAKILADRAKQFSAAPLSNWWDWRRKRFWVLALLALYTLAGFFLAPWVARRELVNGLQDSFALPVAIDELRINPWTLTIEAKGFSVNEPDGSTIVGFDRLFVNLQVSSLFRRALTFREITLDHPYGQVTRYQDGALNIDPILLATSAEPDQAPAEPSSGSLRLLIHDLSLNDGQIETRDESRATPFIASVGPVNIAVQDLTTLPDKSGQHQIAVSTARGTRLEWSGSLELDPIISSGHVTGTGPYLPLLYQYFQDELNFELTEGHVDLEFDYEVAVDPESGLRANITNSRTVLSNTALETNDVAGARTRFASLPEIRLEAGEMFWPEQTMHIGELVLTDPEIRLWLGEDGGLNIQRLLAPSAEPTEPSTPEPENEAPPWDIRLGEFRIENLQAEFTDHRLDSDGTVGISDLDFSLRNITNQPGDAFPIDLSLAVGGGGTASLSGEIQALPHTMVNTDLTIEGLALDISQPWLNEVALVEIDAGTLDVAAKLTVTQDEPMLFTGGLKIPDLDISDTTIDERLIGWGNMSIDRMSFSVAENSLEISKLTFDTPYSRLRIAEDQSTNFQELAVSDVAAVDSPVPDAEPVSDADSIALMVGQIVVNDGSADFSDLSLPLPFAARISELNGQIDTLATVSEEPAKISLAGKVDEYGLVEISGQVKPLDPTGLTDIGVLFRNVGMPGLSPYTIKFAGREIDEGSMELDLRYVIDSGQLQGENSIVIDKLRLGDKVDHPDAVSLPLGLAVALLKGPDGAIDIDMPVSGDVDDPEFSVGGVVFKAFVNLITKIATSPFNLLGKLVGVESEDFDRIEFRPGVAELSPPEQEKLVKLSEAMSLRPSLDLELSGVTDPAADSTALKSARVDAAIDARLAEQSDDSADATMLTERRRQVVEALAQETLTAVDFAALKATHPRPKDPEKPDGRQVLDAPAYTAALEVLLVDNETITDTDLDELAMGRANAVRSAITGSGQITANRVAVAAPSSADLSDSGWIPMQLELSSGSRNQVSGPSVSN